MPWRAGASSGHAGCVAPHRGERRQHRAQREAGSRHRESHSLPESELALSRQPHVQHSHDECRQPEGGTRGLQHGRARAEAGENLPNATPGIAKVRATSTRAKPRDSGSRRATSAVSSSSTNPC
jgi:hypothetical protein